MIDSLDFYDDAIDGALEAARRKPSVAKNVTGLILERVDLLRKATFGGNRSQAGRYAAQVRWGRRGQDAMSTSEIGDRAKAAATRTFPLTDDGKTGAEAIGVDPDATDEEWAKAADNFYVEQSRQLGFFEPAQAVTAEQFDELAATGDYVVVYRGASAEQHASLLTGNPTIGDGAMGKGIYTSPDYDRAEPYARPVKYEAPDRTEQFKILTELGDTAGIKMIQETDARNERIFRDMKGPDRPAGELRPYLVPKAGLTAERVADDAWGNKYPSGVRYRLNASYGQSENYAGTDDLLIHNIGMLIQGPAGHRGPAQSFAEAHPWR